MVPLVVQYWTKKTALPNEEPAKAEDIAQPDALSPAADNEDTSIHCVDEAQDGDDRIRKECEGRRGVSSAKSGESLALQTQMDLCGLKFSLMSILEFIRDPRLRSSRGNFTPSANPAIWRMLHHGSFARNMDKRNKRSSTRRVGPSSGRAREGTSGKERG